MAAACTSMIPPATWWSCAPTEPRCSDPEEHVAEPLGQAAVAARGTAVDPAHRREHETRRVEVQHQRKIADVARLERHPFLRDGDPGLSAVVAGQPHADREGLHSGALGG